jgi:triosephosphate isomerase
MSDRRLLIAGNWKMNLNRQRAGKLTRGILEGLGRKDNSADVVLAPPFLSFTTLAELLANTQVGLAGQNMHAEPEGAFTGETSGEMLRDAGAGWVILGHSERRQYFAEDDAEIARKTRAAFLAGLLPILCVGEQLEDRETGLAEQVVLGQVDGVLAGLSEIELNLVTLAYEPVWAIGTGLTATDEQAQEIHAAIRGHLQARHGDSMADGLRILYGGSVKPDNVAGLMAQPDVDGALVGGASLDAESFLALIPPYPAP